MSEKIFNRITAAFVFLVTLIVYMKTLSVTVVFWDVGEFCAAAHLMQVPHPPGSPLFVMLARVAEMIPFLPDPAARMHAVSALSSAVAIMFLYLTLVKVLGRFFGEIKSTADRVMIYGSSVIGSLALAFSTTYWDNAIEAEVYGLSMFFVSFIIWLTMRWWERAEEPRNERYVLLIAYLIGLSSGIHLLALLGIFPLMAIMYFRLYEVNIRSFIKYGIATVVALFIVYPGIVQYLPSMLDGDWGGIHSDLLPFLPLAILIAVIYGAYRSYHTKHRIIHVACLSILLVVVGYTTYTAVLIRSNARPPMNENDPSTLANLVKYISREQYGETPLLKGESWDNNAQDYREKTFPRRYSREPMHQETRTNYTDDWDFFWRYQTKHMFLRYVGWNFIGSEGDWQDAGVSWKNTWGIPFLIGLFGLFYQIWKDKKMAYVFGLTFIVMGFILDWYQNQQQPQPRERDYFYVGAYYVWSLWIGVGLLGIYQLLKEMLKSTSVQMGIATALVIAGTIVVPVSLAKMNYKEHDRSKNYIAWDYSYNILQSCEPNAILFTNGDNDTFPLWYLQDVEGVRQDIRIVNLSLVNTPWYIYQLRNEEPHGAKKVPMSLTNAAIEQIEPRPWKARQVDLPVPGDVLRQFIATDKPQLPNWSIDSSVIKDGRITFNIAGVPYNNDMRFLRVQDIMIWEIVRSNNWERPIYFAATCSPDSKLGLDEYLWMQGLALKLKPFKVPSMEAGLDQAQMETNLMRETDSPTKTFQSGFRWRNLNDSTVYYDENTQRMVMNYRASFLRLYEYAMRVENNQAKGKQVLQRMEQLMPVSVIPNLDWRYTAHFMNQFMTVGDMENFNKYANLAEKKCLELIAANDIESQDFNPYQILTTIYDTRKDYNKALEITQQWKSQFDGYAVDPRYANDRNFQGQLMYLKQQISRYEQLLKTPQASTPDTAQK